MKKIILLLMTLIMVLSLIACGATAANNVYGRDDKNIVVEAGKTFKIQLEENPTTGYAWTANIGDEKVVSLEGEEYRQDPGSEDAAGAGGVKTLIFKAQEKGNTSVKLVYERSFEEDSAVETLIYSVTVN